MANKTILQLLRYDNYYNRRAHQVMEYLSDYREFYAGNPLFANFNPNDGITTNHVFDLNAVEVIAPDVDYMIAADTDTGKVISRWYVVEVSREGNGKYTVGLKRDVITDYYDVVMNADCYIERGMVNIGNPLIFNSEGMSYNQIKKREELLKDETNSAWIVGYCDVKAFDTEVNISVPSSGTVYPAPPVDFDTLTSYGNQKLYTFIDSEAKVALEGTTRVANAPASNQIMVFSTAGYIYNAEEKISATNDTNVNILTRYLGRVNEVADKIAHQISQLASLSTDLIAFGKSKKTDAYYQTNTDYNTIASMGGNTYYDGTRAFKVSINSTENTLYADGAPSGSGYYNDIKAIISAADVGSVTGSIGVNAQLPYKELTLSVEVLPVDSISGKLMQSLKILRDAPYRMFAIPYNEVGYYTGETIGEFEVVNYLAPTSSLAIATEIAKQLQGGAFLYDLQLLPFCPFRNLLDQGTIRYTRGAENVDYTLIKDSQNALKSIILWGESSSFSFYKPLSISVPTNAIDFKIDHETKFCRLVSPNYAGAFEFKPTSNRGISGFEINCTYKPYSPYIHVNPLFTIGGLYGGDFNDNRGLVCGGSFALPLTTDAWKQYQIQNKSYADSFERQIQNMETTYNIERAQTKAAGIIGAVTGGLTGSATGAIATNIFGHGNLKAAGIGGAVSGIVQGAGSIAGLAADLHYMDQLHKESKSYAADQYNMSLQNIKALPNTLSSVSAFDINSKLFPFVEFYEATETETNALRNKIKYTSMAVNVIDTLTNYKGAETTWVQGQVIRFNGLDEDYHLAVSIAEEIHKGVFI